MFSKINFQFAFTDWNLKNHFKANMERTSKFQFNESSLLPYVLNLVIFLILVLRSYFKEFLNILHIRLTHLVIRFPETLRLIPRSHQYPNYQIYQYIMFLNYFNSDNEWWISAEMTRITTVARLQVFFLSSKIRIIAHHVLEHFSLARKHANDIIISSGNLFFSAILWFYRNSSYNLVCKNIFVFGLA